MSKFKSPLQQAVVGWLADHPDLTQRGLAERARIDRGDMSRIVSGEKASLSMELAGRLAAAMEITVEDLLAGRAASPSGTGTAQAVETIPLALIDPSPHNPRKTMDEAELADLAASIAEQGLLSPLLVMRSLTPGRYELIAGHRRLRALQINQAESAVCIVRRDGTASTSRALQIIENLQRIDIAPLEEAQAFAELQDESPAHWTAKAIAKAIGKSDRFVAQRLALARNLAPELKERLTAGAITVEVARTLATAPVSLQQEVAANRWSLADAATVRSQLHAHAVPVGKAAFRAELYVGPYLEEGDRKWFADVPQFDRLQRAAAGAMVGDLKASWPAARFVTAEEVHNFVRANDGAFIHPSFPGEPDADGRDAALAAEDCTALIYLDRNREIVTLTNVVPRDVWMKKTEGRDADGDDEDRDADGGKDRRAETRQEIEALNARMAEGIAGRPDIAKRLVIYSFLGHIEGMESRATDVQPLVAAWPDMLSEFVSEDGDFYEPHDASEDRLWTILAAQDEPTIDAMLARFLSGTVAMSLWQGETSGLFRAIAAAVGLEIPAKFAPVPEADTAEADAEAA